MFSLNSRLAKLEENPNLTQIFFFCTNSSRLFVQSLTSSHINLGA